MKTKEETKKKKRKNFRENVKEKLIGAEGNKEKYFFLLSFESGN